jgi:hypothetical protein
VHGCHTLCRLRSTHDLLGVFNSVFTAVNFVPNSSQ